MTAQEVAIQQKRIEKYESLERLREDARRALGTINEKVGKDIDLNPFTGNTREARTVLNMQLDFSRARGGAEACEINIHNLFIDAYDLGVFLRQQLNKRIKDLTEEIEKI